MTAQIVYMGLHSGLLCVMFAHIGASLGDGAVFCAGFALWWLMYSMRKMSRHFLTA